jgi:hypothetical protein
VEARIAQVPLVAVGDGTGRLINKGSPRHIETSETRATDAPLEAEVPESPGHHVASPVGLDWQLKQPGERG